MYLVQLATLAVVMLRDEPIHTIAAATSLAGIVFLGGVIHRTLSPKTNYSAQNAAGSSGSARKKKGKKGRHGRQNNNNARGRGKVRGGHFRSSKDLYESPTRNRSRSRSLTPPRPEKKQSEEKEAAGSIAGGINMNTHSSNGPTDKSGERLDSTGSLAAHSQSQNSLTKLRPYSVDSSLPQLSDDVSSCSSITGSLIDVPGSKPLKGVLEEVDKKSNRRKNKNQKRKNSTAVGLQCHNTQASTSQTPPGFIADDPAMTPSRVSPLTLSNPSPSSYKGKDTISISPARKTISRPPPQKKGNHTSNRSRASTGDGLVKHAHSAPLHSANANVYNATKLQSQSQPLNRPPGIVRYGLPDYSAYAQSDNRYDPKKLELAAFLTRVGLVGSACADLLRDLLDVDSLAALTPQQLYMYNVGDEKQMEIAALLKARELRLLQQRMQNIDSTVLAPSPVIRPPPGLGFGSASSPASSAIAPLRSQPVQPISRPLTQARSFTPDSTTSELLLSSPASANSNHVPSNFTLQSLRSSVDNSGPPGNASSSMMQASLQHDQSRLPPIGPRLFPSTSRAEYMQSEDEKIDADLQQLGDRMAGSILDF